MASHRFAGVLFVAKGVSIVATGFVGAPKKDLKYSRDSLL
jgi:hypothetical protein